MLETQEQQQRCLITARATADFRQAIVFMLTTRLFSAIMHGSIWQLLPTAATGNACTTKESQNLRGCHGTGQRKDKLTLFTAALWWPERRSPQAEAVSPESVTLIKRFHHGRARDGTTVAAPRWNRRHVPRDQVMEGVPK